MRRALVLSGGGAKGAYQIGVWKALRKLKIDFSIVTGTSVGSLNGILMVQNDYRKGKKLWKNMKFDVVFDEKIVQRYNNCKTTMDMIQMFSSGFIKYGGMKPSNLEILLKKYFRPKKFFRSACDFGITTYNVSELTPIKLTKKDMTEDNVLDYVLASSSCFPAFEMKKIGKHKYIDGGIFDYIPINLALDLGAEEIIAVDLHAPGIKEKVRKTDVPITYIEPNNDIGSLLNFDKDNAIRAIKYGYLDTMKKFGYLEGLKYYYKRNTIKNVEQVLLESVEFAIDFVFDFEEERSTFEEFIASSSYKRLNSLKKQGYYEMFEQILENLASIFCLDNTKVYNFYSLHFNIWKEFRKTKDLSEENIRELLKNKKVLSVFSRRSIIKYFYEELVLAYRDSDRKKKFCKMALLFPKESLYGIYLFCLRKEVWWIW